jgi:enolase
MFIERAWCRTILDSRKQKTVEVFIKSHQGIFSASAPAGKSKGKNEVADYNERGIIWSIKLANKFLGALKGRNIVLKEIDDLKDIEKKIKDFEKSYGIIGGNVVYAIESAMMKSAAKENRKDLWRFVYDSMGYKDEIKMPMPVGNCVGGGLHSKGMKGKKPDFQEFELIPQEETFSKAVTKNIHAYFYAKKLFKKMHKKWTIKTNDENALETNMSNEETLKILSSVAEKYGLRIGLDVAASSFVNDKNYYIYKNKELIRDRLEQIDYMRIIAQRYNLLYLEDPLDEEDFSGFQELLSKIQGRQLDTLIVGDDLTTTNLKRVDRAVRGKAINAMIVKPNQIGSFVEVKRVIEFCKKHNIKTIFSHRSGETMDYALGDFAVGFQADFVKTGLYGPERLIKLRRIMQIEKEILRND